MTEEKTASSYLELLPAVYSEDAGLGSFLRAFEYLLTRAPDDAPPALEQVVDGIDRYFRPFSPDPYRQAPLEFLGWLSGWVALTLREDWDEDTRRRFLQRIVSLYRFRGTRKGLLAMLLVYVGQNTPVTIYDTPAEFGFEPPPHFFQVEITLTDRDLRTLYRKQQIALAIIEQEKPGHTYYALRILTPTMRLVSEELFTRLTQEGVAVERLVLGQNTLLGKSSIQRN